MEESLPQYTERDLSHGALVGETHYIYSEPLMG